jgi:dTDP-glucose 4,6-dehydratase
MRIPRKIAILGAGSFCGRSFANHCIFSGYEVLGIHRGPKPDLGSIKYFQGDLRTNSAQIANHIVEWKADVVVNFAAESMVAASWIFPAGWYDTNATATVQLLEHLRRQWYGLFVHFSTPEVYGHTPKVISEDERFNPSTPYAVSRLAADLHLKAIHKAYGFPMMITRACNIYGPGQQSYRLIPWAIHQLKTDSPFPLDGAGDSIRAFMHSRDMSDGLMKVIRDGVIGDTYHITNNDFVETGEVLSMLESISGKKLSFTKHDERLGKDRAYLMSGKKLEALGFKSNVSLPDGLRECWESESRVDKLKPYTVIDQDQVSV